MWFLIRVLMMRNYLLVLLCSVVFSWSIPKPMESIENYNVMIIHGAYSACQLWGSLQNELG